MKIFRRRNIRPSSLDPVQAQPGIDPGKNIVYQFAAWWVGVITLWFLASLLIIAPVSQSLGAVDFWLEANWDLKWLTLVLGLAGALPFYVMRIGGKISGRRYYVKSINIERSRDPKNAQSESRMANIVPYRELPPVIREWWFKVPYDIGDGILEWPMTLVERHAPGIEPIPPTDLPPVPEPEPRPHAPRGSNDPPESPYNDQKQGFSSDRRWDTTGDFAEDRKPESF